MGRESVGTMQSFEAVSASLAAEERSGGDPARTQTASIRTQQSSNGLAVRLVGRCRLQDGWTYTLAFVLLCLVFSPYVIWMLVKARRCRSSWSEVWFQFLSAGDWQSAKQSATTDVQALDTEGKGPEGLMSLFLHMPSGGVFRGSRRFVCISDTHMRHAGLPPLPAGDVLIHAGDFTNFGSLAEVESFLDWIVQQPHPVKIVVPGNHDMLLDDSYYDEYWADWSGHKESHHEAVLAFERSGVRLLIDKTLVIDGLIVYGSPWVTQYASWRTAFNKSPAAIERVWRGLPENIDVLITHQPPFGCGDRELGGAHSGCAHLAARTAEIKPKLHVFGHVHTDAGLFPATNSEPTVRVNASSVSDFYRVGQREAYVVDVPMQW